MQQPLLGNGFANRHVYTATIGNISRGTVSRAYSTNGEKRNAYRIFVGNPERKRPLGRPRHRWVDNIEVDLREIGTAAP
jgi:hypothetical protein